jgi:SHS2 domain-containing protein
MHETFDHTADLGLRIRAADLKGLFTEAAEALFEAIVVDRTSIRPISSFIVELPQDQNDYLLFDWLNRLLLQFDTEHVVFGKFEVRLDENGLHGVAWGETFDPERHVPNHEVKAITYHGLKVKPEENAWLAEVIVDI